MMPLLEGDVADRQNALGICRLGGDVKVTLAWEEGCTLCVCGWRCSVFGARRQHACWG